MKALLLKDWYVIRRIAGLYLLVVLATQSVSVTGLVFLAIYPALLPVSAFAYDDRSHWGELAVMMPFSVWDLVLSRYVLGWLCIAGFSLVVLALRGILGLFPLWIPTALSPAWLTRLMGPTELFHVWLAVCGAASVMALSLPLYFRFDAEKGRAVRALLIAVICGVLGAGYTILGISSTYGGGVDAPAVDGRAVGLAALAAVVLTAVSIPLSVLAHRRRYR